jgi:hypothetical protein
MYQHNHNVPLWASQAGYTLGSRRSTPEEKSLAGRYLLSWRALNLLNEHLSYVYPSYFWDDRLDLFARKKR